jgi:ferredoxin
MKVHVDLERCQGHGLCSVIAPEVFGVSDPDGHPATIVGGKISADLEDAVDQAARSCPEQAITVSEGPEYA